MSEEIKFKGLYDKTIYTNNDYRICAINPTSCEDNLELSKYGNVTIAGEFQELVDGVEYSITSIPEKNKYGTTYKVIYITTDKPNTLEGTYMFLREILTDKQAETLFEVYPNIVDMVKNDETPDFKKLKGIGEKTWRVIKEKILNNFVLIDIVEMFKGRISLNVARLLYRKYTNVEMVRKKILEDPYYCMCSLSRVGFKRADEILISLSKDGVIDFGVFN